MVSNPYNPPAPSRDDPHQGVDLAIIDPATGIALQGHPVQAVFSGQVALVIQGRFPYGNAILIETPLDNMPASWADQPAIPPPAPTITPHPALTCPPVESVQAPQTSQRSLYLLYAHLEQLSALQPGDSVGCGETIGAVGMTGNALNPHLHLEARVGPAGTRLDSMAHYDSSASPAEMAAYCLWRVSGAFQRINPLQLLLYNSSVSLTP
jgi:murein DD-endopeptidase MepM/ murein hydrolase activator NlpD